jgi:replicative DNA helicase
MANSSYGINFEPQVFDKQFRSKQPYQSAGYEALGNKIPPHSPEAEAAVLGAMMVDRSAIAKVIEILEVESFYNEANKRIFEAIMAMFERSINVDILTISEELGRRNLLEVVGGSYYLAEISSSSPSASNVENHAMIVQEKYLKRLLISIAGHIIDKSYDPTTDAFEEIDQAERSVFEIAEKRFSRSYIGLNKLTHDTYDMIYKLYEKGKPGLTGVPTGYKQMNDYLGGFQKSDFIVIAARPSMGKTALGLSIARNIAVNFSIPVAFFSIEMSAIQLVIRLISAEAKINQQKIRTGELKHEDMTRILKNLDKLTNAPIFIDDSPTLSVMELRAKCRRLKAEHKIECVFIDYLQLIHAPKSESREREISYISRSLKQMAKELDIPIVALAQLNRSVETRSEKKPMLSDLRESGSIEQDSDVVMFINRPEQYGIGKFDDDTPSEGLAEIIIGKQRNGPTANFKLAYMKDYARFENPEFRYDEPPPGLIESEEEDDQPW